MIRERVDRLLSRLATGPQFKTQGRTLFVDLERQELRTAYTPRSVVDVFLGGRGVNMFYLANLLDPSLTPEDPQIPLVYGSGICTGVIPSASRGNMTSWSPDSRILLDSNAGDYFASFLRLNGIDHLVLYGRAERPTLLYVKGGELSFRDATPYWGLDNLDMRDRIAGDFHGRWGGDLAMLNITRAGENGVREAGVMTGPKSIHARGGGGAKMGSLNLKAIVIQGLLKPEYANPPAVPKKNREIAVQFMETGVGKILHERGTPFLYKPSRQIWAMGTKNNQETVWVPDLDSENFDPFRPSMTGCFRCPVNCRPMNDVTAMFPQDADLVGLVEHVSALGYDGMRYLKGDGPEYVTVGKFGPNLGVQKPQHVIYFNNICNDLGLDTAAMGGNLSWAMELYQRGMISRKETGGLDLAWGNLTSIAEALFLTAKRQGFGRALAAGSAAVDEGFYPPGSEKYRMTVKRTMQSDPHDARILKAFALGLAVSTRGFDHLRNRVTLEINARINDDPAYKARLYGGPVSGKPNAYDGKELAVKACEDMYAVGDAVGMCRFTTKLFNSPNLPGYDQFVDQIRNATGLAYSEEHLAAIGSNIRGIERMINHTLGVRAKDDWCPDRWYDEPLKGGPYAGEKLDRAAYAGMLERFYRLCRLNAEGVPTLAWREQLNEIVFGFNVTVHLPRAIVAVEDGAVTVTEETPTVGLLLDRLSREFPEIRRAMESEDSLFNVAINEQMFVEGIRNLPLKSGDHVELIQAFAGG
ncbi:MAG TPA: aldehyde ferredoxin oxidoreductase C-terminal domain-containing protein [Thermoplasmata archaeon]|jgi:aldehyde:ferredoxin oxidoreductase|nr:aldehyde ferredoxin oxidoreductase C-terminal domain-containing protein [Thermoplasmata archaeon]